MDAGGFKWQYIDMNESIGSTLIPALGLTMSEIM
jgi:hypothetical protein